MYTCYFGFQILPSIVFFTTVVTLLQYFGVIQAVVRTMGRFLAFVLGVSAPEAMNASANIFVGGVSKLGNRKQRVQEILSPLLVLSC